MGTSRTVNASSPPPQEMPPQGSALPPHVADSVRSIIDFNAEHEQQASFSERSIERTTSALGTPRYVATIIVCAALWVAANVVAARLHLRVLDPPPFYALQGVVSFTALCTTALILTTQRRLDRLGEERAQLTLQLAMVGEQKTTKIIALLEELRADHPEMPDRLDVEAEAMSATTDPQSVLEALRETNAET